MSNANLTRADLSGAKLDSANLFEAKLRRADLRKASLTLANLRGADLTEAQLADADLKHADLSGSTLSGADLQGADLEGVNLIHADLTAAKLWEANLRHARLIGAHLHVGTLHGADLSGAILDGTASELEFLFDAHARWGILMSVRWSSDTHWPGLWSANRIREFSDEIAPGVWQVTLKGPDAPGRSETLQIAETITVPDDHTAEFRTWCVHRGYIPVRHDGPSPVRWALQESGGGRESLHVRAGETLTSDSGSLFVRRSPGQGTEIPPDAVPVKRYRFGGP